MQASPAYLSPLALSLSLLSQNFLLALSLRSKWVLLTISQITSQTCLQLPGRRGKENQCRYWSFTTIWSIPLYVRYWFLVTDLKYTLMPCFSSFQTVDIKVKMDCDGCERRVKNSVSSMKGTKLRILNLSYILHFLSPTSCPCIIQIYKEKRRDLPETYQRVANETIQAKGLCWSSLKRIQYIGVLLFFQFSLSKRFKSVYHFRVFFVAKVKACKRRSRPF